MPGDTILVVDDSPTILKVVQLVLTKAGYRVISASDGEAGIALAREDAPQLVLLDRLLPFMDGIDVCRALSEEPALRDIPVVLMSAKGDALDPQLPNVADSITKPFAPEALTAVISHVLEARRPARLPSDDVPGAEPGPLVLAQETQRSELGPDDGPPAGAGLIGDLAVISLADVLTLLQDEAHTGTLTLAKDHMRVNVFFRQGRVDLALALGVPEEFLLGRFLVEAKVVSGTDLARVIEERRQADGAIGMLGADLMARGLLAFDGLQKAMALQSAALVFEGLRWGAGRFWFEAAEALPEPAREVALSLGVDGLLMEGFRRVDEWRLIEREVGDFDMVFVRADEKLAAFGRGRLTREELAVLEFVNGKNSVRDIVQLSRLGSFDVSKMLYRLLRSKLIRRRVPPVAV